MAATQGGGGAGTTEHGRVRRADPGVVASVVLLVVGCYAALSIDVVSTGYGVKGDESTYVAMALSAAYDGDLAYEARDIERFYQFYNTGPDGIFLKRGGNGREADDRLYFGKAYAYSVAAAPFVRLAGLNGFLVFHVVLLAGMLLLGYRFVAARSPDGLSLTYTLGFFGVSIVPLYAVFLTSEIFNVACVFYAYFLWFYKEVAPVDDDSVTSALRGRWTDVAGVVLLAIGTFSKPLNVLLIAPPVLFAWSRRRFGAGVALGAVFVLVVAGGFAVNALITGEVVYQGGDRKSFYGVFPFETPGATFDALGIGMATNAVVIEERLGPIGFLALLGTNLSYFLVGRHFGFVPFFFPGLVAIWLFLRRRVGRTVWGWAILATVVATAVGTIIYMPYSWSGGGGPPGNRYFLSIYPALFFITPPLVTVGPVVVAWLGGALFTAHILLNPFVSAKQPYRSVERGMLRTLPVELTMVYDLPINLAQARSRIEYGEPRVLLYYLDHNAYRPEAPGIWIAAGRRADIIVQSGPPLTDVTFTLTSPVANMVEVRMGGPAVEVELEPGVARRVTLSPEGVYSRRSWAYLLTIRTEDGFVPRLVESGSRDGRYLGVAFTLGVTFGEGAQRSPRGW
jgi:hypothetical protein